MSEELLRALIGALETTAIRQDDNAMRAIEASSDEHYSLEEVEEMLDEDE